MKAAAERSGFAPVKNAEVYGSLAAASFVFNLFFVALLFAHEIINNKIKIIGPVFILYRFC